MKNLYFVIRKMNFVFLLTVIVIIGNIIFCHKTAFGAERKYATTLDKSQIQDVLKKELADKDYNDKMFERYLNKLFYGDNRKFGDYWKSDFTPLNDNEKILYTKLKEIITEIAEGKRENTNITINELSGYKFTGIHESTASTTREACDEISKLVDDMFANLNIDKITDILLIDCPYELYWHKKTLFESNKSISYKYFKTTPGNIQIEYKVTLGFAFGVAGEYAQKLEDGTYAPYLIDNSKIQLALLAKDNVDKIIHKYELLNDYEKLHAYLEEICSLVTYDNNAIPNSGKTITTNPWQLISVFDNDDTTNVVCEGYSKAFAYLCEKSNFQNNIKCYIVSGESEKNSEVGHMWNIVTMENGKNYIVDITNCDDGMIGNPDLLFLAGAEGDVDNGYTFTRKSNGQKLNYIYYDTIKQLYPKSILEISETDYHTKTEEQQNPSVDDINKKPSSTNNKYKTIKYKNNRYKISTSKSAKTVSFVGIIKNTKTVTIPSSIKINGKVYKVTKIADNAMKNNKKIRKLIIGANVKSIGKNAFKNCKKLREIVIKTKKLTPEKIGDGAFSGVGDTTVKIPKSKWNDYDAVLDKLGM